MPTDAMLALSEFLGFALAAYGVLRESFVTLAQERAYGEGRYGEGSYGGASRIVRLLVDVGNRLRLLPKDRTLTLTDRRRNAALAVSGTLLLGVSLVAEVYVGVVG
jgi:hypothetical protein